MNRAVCRLLRRQLRENGENKRFPVQPCCAPFNVTAANGAAPRRRSADNERINMYIPSQVNARRRSNFTARSRVDAACAGTSKPQFPH